MKILNSYPATNSEAETGNDIVFVFVIVIVLSLSSQLAAVVKTLFVGFFNSQSVA